MSNPRNALRDYHHPDDELDPQDEGAFLALFGILAMLGGMFVVKLVEWAYIVK